MVSIQLPTQTPPGPFIILELLFQKHTFRLHSFFDYLARSRYLSFFSHSFSFIQWWAGTAMLTNLQILYFFITIWSDFLDEIRWSVCMSNPHRCLCMSFSGTGAGLCTYHLSVWSKLNVLHISQLITLPTQSCLILYSFCAQLLQSHIMWWIFSSLSLHSLHLLFFFFFSLIYPRFDMIYFYGVILCCYLERFCFPLKVLFS